MSRPSTAQFYLTPEMLKQSSRDEGPVRGLGSRSDEGRHADGDRPIEDTRGARRPAGRDKIVKIENESTKNMNVMDA